MLQLQYFIGQYLPAITSIAWINAMAKGRRADVLQILHNFFWHDHRVLPKQRSKAIAVLTVY